MGRETRVGQNGPHRVAADRLIAARIGRCSGFVGSLGKRVPAANPAAAESGAVGPADTRDGEEKWRIKMELKELENEVLKLSGHSKIISHS